MSSILFIRHGETDLAGTFCGHTNPELNARGSAQVAALVSKLAQTPIGAVYTSDLRRALATAQAIAHSRGLVCRRLPALREIDFGHWEGLRWNEIEQLDPTFAQLWVSSFPTLPAPGGECFTAFRQRVLRAVAELKPELKPESDQQIVVVTHAGILRVVLEGLCGVTPAQAWEQSHGFCSIVHYQLSPVHGEVLANETL